MISNPTGPITVVRINRESRDPALDDKMDFEKYADTRDPSLIKEKDGQRATRFELTPLDAIFCAEYVDSKLTIPQQNMMAFLASCHAYTLPSGNVVRADVKVGAYGQPMASMEWAREVAARFGITTMYELGHVTWTRTRLPVEGALPLT